MHESIVMVTHEKHLARKIKREIRLVDGKIVSGNYDET